MKTVLIIGMGRFGRHLCRKMVEQGNEVMIADKDEAALEELLPLVIQARAGDCTNPEVLRSLGVGNFDYCFVCMGTNFQSSLEITSLLKEAGAAYVVSQATRDIQAKFLLRNGADEVIYPDKDIAEKWAERYSLDNIFDYINLPGAFGIYEMAPLKEWLGKSIRESNIAAKYKVSILGVKKAHDEQMSVMPSADYVIKETDHLMIMAANEVAEKLLKQNKRNFVKQR